MARILESSQPQNLGTDVPLPHTLQTGPFAGLELQSASPTANAARITQSLIDTYLITHPHLDHISAFVINTAGLPGSRPKTLAGLPNTIAAFKTHIFNNVIWPNLSDENNGAGLVTYMRLVEGGSPALGSGEEKGYVEISDGLSVKTWGVSHGHCIERHSHRGSQSGQGGRFGSADASAASPIMRSQSHPHMPTSNTPTQTPSHFPSQLNPLGQNMLAGDSNESICVYDSSAYFIRDLESGKEVLIFGDVEPDSISLTPRNLQIWHEAAPKIASGMLRGIFIECSYDNSQAEDRLFGHLKPCYVIEELKVLAEEVENARKLAIRESKKRKRAGSHSAGSNGTEGSLTVRNRKKVCEEPVSPKSMKPVSGTSVEPRAKSPDMTARGWNVSADDDGVGAHNRERSSSSTSAPKELALKGLKVVIIHVKDPLVDGHHAGEKILKELRDEDEIERLGCEFVVSHPGQSIFF